jgi:hypothetical protein
MYRINQQTTAGFILICSWLFLSCNNSSLDDCETLFIQNLGITNETYALIQNGDRFLTEDEAEQFEAAYFGEGSMEGNKDRYTFEIIIDAYRNCRKTQPLNSFEVELIKSEIVSAFQKDSIGLIRNYATSDSLSAYQAAIKDTMELLKLAYYDKASGAIVKDLRTYMKEVDNGITRDVRFGRLRSVSREIDMTNRKELLDYYYSARLKSLEHLITENKYPGWSCSYFYTIGDLVSHYGEKNIGIELVKTLPRPNPADYEHLRGYSGSLHKHNWLFE